VTDDGPIVEYIRLTRHRFTRDAITQRLRAAGHSDADVDAAWDLVAADTDDEVATRDRGERASRVIAISLAVVGILLIGTFVLGYSSLGLEVGLGFVLLLGAPATWFWPHRALGVLALLAYLAALLFVGMLSLIGAAYTGKAVFLLWTLLYFVAGAWVVRLAFRWQAPASPLRWVGAVIGVIALVLLVAGGTCLASVPFLNL
jgi:hypothetical protein